MCWFLPEMLNSFESQPRFQNRSASSRCNDPQLVNITVRKEINMNSVKFHSFVPLLLTTAMMVIPAACLGQTPDGSDINRAIPIYFGQTVNDTGDGGVRPLIVYSITLAKGQSVAITATLPSQQSGWGMALVRPSAISVYTLKSADYLGCWPFNECLGNFSNQVRAATGTYEVATAGTYYIVMAFYRGGISYKLEVNAVGTPIGTPNPALAGCVTGQVDYITYSLQLVAAALPDEASIGGTKLCADCAVKAPAYPQLANKLENAMGLNLGVSACYDADGKIFQIKLMHP